MAYNQFKKLEQLQKKFGINDLTQSWLPRTYPAFQPSDILLQNLDDAREESLITEKARSEYIIAPILKDLRRNNPHQFSSFSGHEFDVDKSLGLNGYCDFILSLVPQKSRIVSPVFCLVEAKREEIDKGWAQCGAEMYAAQLFNAQEGTPKKAVYGCVTSGFL